MWNCASIFIVLMTWKYNISQGTATNQPEDRIVNNLDTDPGNPDDALGEIDTVHVEAVYHEERKKVVLYISWNTSLVPDSLDSYIFKVSPKPTFAECEDISHETIKKDTSITSIYLPIPQHSYEVKPGCSYTIILVADFLHHGKISKATDYTLPECVGKKCFCRNLKPAVENFLAEEIKPAELQISWSLQNQTNSKINNISPPIFEYRPVVLKNHHTNPFRSISAKKDLIKETYIVKANTQNIFDPGQKYQLRVLFNNSYNCKTYEYTNFTISDKSSTVFATPSSQGTQNIEPKHSYLLHITLLIFVLVAALTIVYILRRNRLFLKTILLNPPSFNFLRRNRRPSVGSLYYVVPNGNKKQEVNLLYVDKEILEGCVDHYEIPRTRITFIRQIGDGAFGQVFLGKGFGIEQQPGYTYVAIKMLREKSTPEETDDFLSEIEILKNIGEHPNIVKLFGCCVLKEPYLMVMEYVPCGDLKNHLFNLRDKWQKRRTKSETTDSSTGSYVIPNNANPQRKSVDRPSITETEYTYLESEGYPTPTEPINHKVENTLDHTELQNFAVQIARGMEHLEKIPIAHRDLAARNILINEFKTLKISDFGLSRVGPYVNSKTKKMPLRWLAVEAIQDNFYDSKSDVWSFAVVLWEIGTLGAFPYDNVMDALLPYYLSSGKRLPRPEICTDELYSLMLSCWSHDPQERPSFKDIVNLLDSKKSPIYVDFNQLNPLYIFPPSVLQQATTKQFEELN